jgi:hypothetical protein
MCGSAGLPNGDVDVGFFIVDEAVQPDDSIGVSLRWASGSGISLEAARRFCHLSWMSLSIRRLLRVWLLGYAGSCPRCR